MVRPVAPLAPYPDALEDEYAAALIRAIRPLSDFGDSLAERYGRSRRPLERVDEDDLATLIGLVLDAQIEMATQVLDLATPAAEDVSASLAVFNRRVVGGQLEALVGFDPLVDASAAVNAEIDRWRREAARLIVTVPERYLDDVEELVRAAWSSGMSTRDLQQRLRSRYGVSAWNAERIARDQIGKLNGRLTQIQHTSIGITDYRWRTSMDSRVRKLHAQREGVRFSYSDPPDESPDDGNPGEPVMCRCTGEPVIDDLLFSLDAEGPDGDTETPERPLRPGDL